jgi:hypothetical protein
VEGCESGLEGGVDGGDVAVAAHLFDDVVDRFRTRFILGADANNLILRTWEKHDVGTTPGFGGDEKKALGSIKAPFCICLR